MRRGFPLAYPRMRVGLFGGSFDPAHEGHAHVAETALKRAHLDRIWWLVTPQNPLKPQSSPLAERMRSAQRFAHGRRMIVSDLETRLGCAYTYQTLRALKRAYPGVRFAFVMGADNLKSFRRWRNWREVARAAPVIVVSRPGITVASRIGMPRGWTYLNARHHPQSSTRLRQS
ncbi:MAG TPA: nicotinate (nicotinamide) nucleotide adenylyltransferase [Caulobacterales bacterium]|nr:nicotinate (nicotinamide) nucleotide adenylyltransferase [Caulobacterales bacterium]